MISMAVFYLGVLAIVLVVIYGIHVEEESRFKSLKGQVLETASRNLHIYNSNKLFMADIKEWQTTVIDALHESETLLDKFGEEVSNLQEFNVMLRKDVIDLHEKLSRKKTLMEVKGPILFQNYEPHNPRSARSNDRTKGAETAAYEPPKNLGRKVKKSGTKRSR